MASLQAEDIFKRAQSVGGPYPDDSVPANLFNEFVHFLAFLGTDLGKQLHSSHAQDMEQVETRIYRVITESNLE